MVIRIPSLCLVMLIGPSGSGKSFFASKHFSSTEILAQDMFQAFISDEKHNSLVESSALELIHNVSDKRLNFGKLTVIDAVNVHSEARKPFLKIAKDNFISPVAFVFNLSENILKFRKPKSLQNPSEIHTQCDHMKSSIKELYKEGFNQVFTFYSETAVNSAVIERIPLAPILHDRSGPFDIIGNLHGCADELEMLLDKLGYIRRQYTDEEDHAWGNTYFSHPKGRTAIFLGDMVDMGPRSIDTIKILRNMKQFGKAICVLGDHDLKFYRKLKGKTLIRSSAMQSKPENLSDLKNEDFVQEVFSFIGGLSSHYILDNGQLVVTHAGIKEKMFGKDVTDVQKFAIYGDNDPDHYVSTTGITDDWVNGYKGRAKVIYSHSPIQKTSWINQTMNINTGCVLGGKLSAYRYPEEEIISVNALRSYIIGASKMDSFKEPI